MPSVVPDKFAILAVDPGKTTGCAQGVFRTDRGDDMLGPVIARAVAKNQISSWQEIGPNHVQAWAICDHWTQFRFRCSVEYGIPLRDIHLVLESFQLRTKQAHLEPVGLSRSIETLLYRVKDKIEMWPFGEPEFQEPSEAKQITNQRLKDLGVYVVGSTHQRDAIRHLVQKVNSIL